MCLHIWKNNMIDFVKNISIELIIRLALVSAGFLLLLLFYLDGLFGVFLIVLGVLPAPFQRNRQIKAKTDIPIAIFGFLCLYFIFNYFGLDFLKPLLNQFVIFLLWVVTMIFLLLTKLKRE